MHRTKAELAEALHELADGEPHDLHHLAEKLGCILGPIIAADPRARQVFGQQLLGVDLEALERDHERAAADMEPQDQDDRPTIPAPPNVPKMPAPESVSESESDRPTIPAPPPG